MLVYCMDNIIEHINNIDNINDLTIIQIACQTQINKLESVDIASKIKQCKYIKYLNVKQLHVTNTITNIYYDTTCSYKSISSKIKFSIGNAVIYCMYDHGDASLTVGNIKIVEYDSYNSFRTLHNSINNDEINKLALEVNLTASEYIEMITCVIDAIITGKYKLK